jgi:tetratricopeptide (TPR) repeat protein
MPNESKIPPIEYDLFVSYRRGDTLEVAAWVAALERAGVRCFFDTQSIAELEDFPQRIRLGIDRSLALLAIWSRGYAESGHCLDEFLRAWQHARRRSSDIGQRIWVMKTEDDVGHIHAGELNAQNFIGLPTPNNLDAWAQGLQERVNTLRAQGALSVELESSPAPPRYGVPHVVTEFTGRQRELLGIHTKLHPAKIGTAGAAVSVQTHGLGGIGKTELAKAYADRFAQAYPGGIWWLNLAAFEPRGDVDISAAESAWLSALESALSDTAPSLSDALLRDSNGKALPANRARECIAQHLQDAGRVLWILDNVPELTPDTAREKVLQLWRAPIDHGATLITTRDSRSTPGYVGFPIDVLTSDDGLHLLIRYWRKVAQERQQPGVMPPQEQIDAAKWLVQHVGGHAKALTLIGAQITSMASAGEFIALKAQIEAAGRLPRLEKIAANLSAIKGELRLGIAATLVTSIQNAIQRSAAARDMLSIAAVCAPNTPISIGLLRESLPDLGEDDFAAAMLALRGASLLTGRDLNTQLAVEMHPLVSDVVIADLEVDRNQHANRMIEVLSLRADGQGDLFHQHRFSPDISQAQWFAASTESEPAILLGLLLGLFYGNRGRYTLAKPIEVRAQAIATILFGPLNYRTLTCMNNLAITLTNLCQYQDAELLMVQARDGRRTALGINHRDTLKSENSLAMIRRHLGVDTGAVVQSTWESLKQAWGDKDPTTLTSMLNRAATLNSDGDLDAALQLGETVLRIRKEQATVPDTDDALYAANNLGQTHYLRGEFAEARRLHEHNLDVLSHKHGDNHRLTMISRSNLAIAIKAQGDYPRACALLEEVLEAKKHHAEFGPDHPSTLTTQANLAAARFDKGDKALALLLSESTMMTVNRTLSVADPVRRKITRIHDAIILRNRNG